MNVVSAFLSSQVTKMLHKDESLMSQLEDLESLLESRNPSTLFGRSFARKGKTRVVRKNSFLLRPKFQ
jgi:hypothetical protein